MQSTKILCVEVQQQTGRNFSGNDGKRTWNFWRQPCALSVADGTGYPKEAQIVRASEAELLAPGLYMLGAGALRERLMGGSGNYGPRKIFELDPGVDVLSLADAITELNRLVAGGAPRVARVA